jgi:hypothetical protein
MTHRELTVRRTIMESFAATGAPPKLGALDTDVVAELERHHVVVVRDGRVWMAHPFAGHRLGTRVGADDGRAWWGNCAWDGLGILAALGVRDAVLTSGDVTLRVREGAVVDDALFHVAVPAAHWWDDIEFT